MPILSVVQSDGLLRNKSRMCCNS